MGGKKKANRTKGNVRPSNSGRSAELLCSSGVATVGFIGFSTLSSDVLNYVPATSQVCEEYISTTVDGDFRMVMRKMFKRDSITKLKALQEFTDLCKNKDEELLKGALPYWPRIYNQLALDFDRRVREATHEAHRQLVKKVGRNLAPHLRSIMGVWLICQNDPYSPAATTAKSSFSEAFPESKQGEALMYCKDEIFNYIQDNLFNQIHQNFQHLTDDNSDLLEDVENRYYRILSCSLEGCKLFILNISPNNYEKIQDLIKKILSETKFWKFAKHKELMVQISWYNLILSLCEKMFHCVRPYASKLCQLTLGSLAQNDPLLTVLTWDATLYILSIFENCWQHVNAKKTVFPQLWIVLKSGGQGNAVILFPKLLPFLSKIPDNLIEDKISFHQNLFNSMRESLNLEKVQNSPSELNSIIQAFIECIQYILSKYCKSEDKELQHHIILNELISLLETSMTEEKSSLASSCLYAKTKELLDYVQYQNANNNSLKKIFEETLTFFWDNFFIMCKSVMDENGSSNQDKLSRLAEFFYCLHCPTRIKKWKVKKKVNFLKEEEFDENLTETENKNIDNDKLLIKQNDYINTNPHLVIPTQKLCETIMMKFETSKNLVYLKLLCEVMSVAASSDLFSILLQSKGILVNNKNSPKEYFYKVVTPWMESIDNVDLDKKQYIYCIVNIVMAICSCIDYREAENILNDFIKCNNPVKLECLMTFTKFETFKFLRKWLQGPNIGEIIVKQAEELCQVTYRNSVKESYVLDSVWNILHLCLTTTEQFEPIIGIEYMSRILEIFRQCLINSKNNQETKKKDVIEFVCDLTVRLFSSFKGYWQIYGAEELLLSLFFISCDLDTSEPISEKLIQSWQLGVKHLIIEKKDFFQQDGFFSKAGIKIHQQLLNQLNCMKSQKKLFLCTFKLLSTMQEALLDDNKEIFHPSISLLLNNIFPNDKEWERLQNSLDSQYVTSTVLSNYLSSVTTEIWPSDSIPTYCLIALFVSEVLFGIVDLYEKQIGDESNYRYIFEKKSQEVLLKQLPSIAMSVTYCTYAKYDYRTTKYVVDAKEKLHVYQNLNNNFSFLLSKLDDKSYLSLINIVKDISLHKGNLWCRVFASTIAEEQREIIKTFIIDLVNLLDFKNIFHLQMLQIMIPYLNLENLKEIITKVTNLILCSEELFSIQGENSLLGILVSCLEVEGVLISADIQEHMITLLEYFLGLKEMEKDHYLTYKDLSAYEEENVNFVSNIMTLLEKIIQIFPSLFEINHWDFVLCSLVGWIETCKRSKLSYDDSPAILHFYVETFNLFGSICEFMKSLEEIKDTSKFPSNLLLEWQDLYTEECYFVCLPLYFQIAENNMQITDLDIGEEIILANLTKGLKYIPLKHIIDCKFSIIESKEDIEESEKIYKILDYLMPLLTSGVRAVQLGAHFLLMKIMPKLANVLAMKEKSDEEDKRSIPDIFIKHLEETGPVVETMLSDFRVGDCCILEPYTDAYTYGRSYLFCWIQLLEFFSASTSEDRSKYASYLRDESLLQSLLNSLFCLMPHNPSLPCDKSTKLKPSSKTMFTEKPLLLIDASDTALELQHVACYVYSNTLQKLPALVRQWWTNQEKRTAEIVNKFTSSYVSSLICSKEIQSVHDDDKKIKNMIVKARPAAREVVAIYTIEEVTIELLIQLPSNHPLGPVVVESMRRVGVAQTQWRNWMLQLTTFLTHQNGSILEGLVLWKHNVDKRFEGVEECMICFYIVHGSTCQLPRLSCRTCKKKFHSACLYKWFNTSNNSTCPLCRNLF